MLFFMNYKLEKFWNKEKVDEIFSGITMNYKLEKFWNFNFLLNSSVLGSMNYKLEKFWNIICVIYFKVWFSNEL